MMLLKLMALVTAVVHMVSAQDRGGSVLAQGESGDTQSVIVTSKTRAFLSCESGDMVVKVNFTEAFRGLMYAHRSRTSPCRIHGTGGFYYELRIPLKGCGTWQESPRVFVNNVTIRFHPALELEEDETKTIVCRYPPPLTQPPGSVQVIEPPTRVTPTSYPTRVGTAKLSEVEILIIICLLLFLSLLTLGIGIAYFCLKRRNIRIIRKGATLSSSAPPSQITRLSSSRLQPPSSLLSSVLGHTVRIPRAVPYSAPVDHHYEDYHVSSAATETTSGETSASSSSVAEDHVDGDLLYRKGGPKSILSIPKAILRKAGPKRWGLEPKVHSHRTSVKRLETEDQTVSAVLGSENHYDEEIYWTMRDEESRQTIHRHDDLRSSGASNELPVPVYAQVDKNKKSALTKRERLSSQNLKASPPPYPAPVPGGARRQQQPQVVTETPEEHRTSEEVTKNTTVTTSVRKEVKETRIVSPMLEQYRKELRESGSSAGGKGESSGPSSPERASGDPRTESSALVPHAQALSLQKPAKTVLIRDIADVYVTTTVETELRELTTKVSRDVVEQHARLETPSPESKERVTQVPAPTPNWNVVIRQREPFGPGGHLDASGESNGESADEPEIKPQFDVKIRTIPPIVVQPKKSEPMMSIPPLEIPKTVSTLKEALKPKTQEIKEDEQLVDKPPEDQAPEEEQPEEEPPEDLQAEKLSPPQRTVRWLDDTKDSNRDEGSTVSSSDSFQSAESLRERSSSEVLEVAPTLPSQQRRHSNRPMLERSTSEMVPEDHVRWVGGAVPVLESLSPEFLANIPVVIQGGFFNRQRPQSPEDHKDVV